jgi:hypothetical protein
MASARRCGGSASLARRILWRLPARLFSPFAVSGWHGRGPAFVDPEPAMKDIYEREIVRLEALREGASADADKAGIEAEIRRVKRLYRVRAGKFTACW